MGPKWGTKVVSKHGANVDIYRYVKLGVKKDATLVLIWKQTMVNIFR